MRLKASEIRDLVGGQLEGCGEATADHVASLDTAGPGAVTFARREFLKKVPMTRASIVIVPEKVPGCAAAQIVVPNPYMAFVNILEIFERDQRAHPKGIHPTAVIEAGVRLGRDVGIGAHAVIGPDTVIGDRTVIYPNVTIGARCSIGNDVIIYSNTALREEVSVGDRTIIHNNCSIGGDGFGYIQVGGRHRKVPQVGRVIIGNDVEIGCNCTIDRATMDATRVGNGVKIDNHSHLAHNVEIGDNSLLIAYCRIGGSTRVGRNVLILEDVGLTNGIVIGDNCVIGACAKVSRSWPAGSQLLGAPAQKMQDEKRAIVLRNKLPYLYEQVRTLRRQVAELAKRLGMDTDHEEKLS